MTHEFKADDRVKVLGPAGSHCIGEIGKIKHAWGDGVTVAFSSCDGFPAVECDWDPHTSQGDDDARTRRPSSPRDHVG